MTPPRSIGFHRLALVALAVGTLLVWIGAAVTTTGSGMAFADWPLSNGSVNPSGWLQFTQPFLEHFHRLLAETIGFLVLGLFLWQWSRAKLTWVTPIKLIVVFIALFTAVHAADATYKGIENKATSLAESVGLGSRGLWILAAILWVGVLVWLIRGLVGTRWSLLLKLSASALVVVVLQAILGGLRVLEVSDPFGIAHGCLGQLFYCLLLVIALVSSAWWEAGPPLLPATERQRLVTVATTLFVVVSLQLVFGALIRHTQRSGLVATDVLTTGGHVIPPTEPFTVFSIFMHKSWAVIVFCLAWITAWISGRTLRGLGWVAWLPKALALLPVIQVTLGVYVLLTARKFWVTNFHVLNGLFILGSAFLLMIVARRSKPRSGLIA
jgi:cytochrome c oxidase assembly protein subunit 15